MPHGRLTPLGKQLRSVLVNLSSLRTPPARRPTPLDFQALRAGAHHGINTSALGGPPVFGPRSIVTAAAPQDGCRNEVFIAPRARKSKPSARVVRRRTRIDHVGNALEATGKVLQSRRPSNKPDLTYHHPRRVEGYDQAIENRKRHARKDGPNAPYLTAVSLQSILAAYLRHEANQSERLTADWEAVYRPSPQEAQLLGSQGYAIEDVAAWANIVAADDTVEAAKRLQARNETHGVLATPLFVFLKLLHRPYVSGPALRLLLLLTWSIFTQRADILSNPGVDSEPRFTAVVRLLRHAREVWPACIPSIVQFVLEEPIIHREEADSSPNEKLAAKTFKLNKLMSLVSLVLAEQPKKDSDYQEASVIPILRYMSEHQPPLHINREGYRAVVRIQLAQRKTFNEQQWAELKALSWPPWKEDRTGMDVLITKEEHGISRAGQTLLRMREAGYAPGRWEQLAGIYTGWDIDNTPTIQTRVFLEQPGLHISDHIPSTTAESLRWAARITCTRTIQEAWACYLAWEEKRLPACQDVFLAIAIKLREEQRRPHVESRATRSPSLKSWPLSPGDMKELSPLPPSTHLETYTRTRPPTLDNFYLELRKRKIAVKNHALAFFVRHARTLQFGLEVLNDAIAVYPGIKDMLAHRPSDALQDVPMAVYVAAIVLFTRTTKTPQFSDEVSLATARSLADTVLSGDSYDAYELNYKSGIVRAAQLLRLRPDRDQTAWNAVYSGLWREANVAHFAKLVVPRDEATAQLPDEWHHPEVDLRSCAGAFLAYRFWWSVSRLQAQQGIDLDAAGFYSFCHVAENRAIATWLVLQLSEAKQSDEENRRGAEMIDKMAYTAREAFHGRSDHRLRRSPHKLFHRLVGAAADRKECKHGLPRLLTVPSPGLLHAYVRAIGWLARYDDILDLAQWMKDYHEDLLERKSQDRNGHAMMRRTIVAMRVFLERSWLPREQNSKTVNAGFEREKEIRTFVSPAKAGLIDDVKALIEEVEEWEGWPTDEEVAVYASDKRFKPFAEYECKRMVRQVRYVPPTAES
ncbi:hypothetical protein CB0940_05335 [Cercospora beticola]|uniref:Uncharacterized protein n=1 Tax=Cercospora beticola TaxID=122368 RepID=A0A2G5HZV3_CERBT|nr:hypothetical protein CB0940_05335 [Cercospora beticola]PIA98069.1 hypothetical protein CB0940_05335 [Cercospora beticola]WPA97872.1 hypothetical protein RHO25_002483 [Cercospora beticola]